MASADVQVPKTHRGVVYDKPGTVSTKVTDLDTPEPGPGEVLINLTHSGVCHSDMSVMLNGWQVLPAPTAEGQVGGHEGVGKVVKLGAGAESHCKVGDRVGVKWIASACGSCPACLNGHDGVCFNQKISGYYHPGTFQQYVIGPANYVTPIPDTLDSAAAAPFLCAGVTVYSALRKANCVAGSYVAVLGAGGGLGHLAVQMASAGFGYRVVGLDHSSKTDFVKGLGAEHFIAFDKEKDVAEAVKNATGGLGVHAVLVLVGQNKAYELSVDLLRFGGRVVCVGLPEGDMQPIAKAFPNLMIVKELSIVGSAVGNRRDAIETLEMAARGIVKLHHRVEKMDKLTEIFQQMEQGKLNGRVVLDLQQ